MKRFANAVAMVVALPALLLYWLGCLVLGAERVFPGWSQAVSLFPGYSGQYLRRAFYARTLEEFGSDTVLCFGSVISRRSAIVRRGTQVGLFCSLGDVTLEEDVLVGSHVSVMNGNAQHGIDRLDVPIRDQHGAWPRVTVGQGSWIGERAIIMADVGRYCVIGAGSIVTRPIPDYAIAVGVPAKVLRFRNVTDVVQEHA